MSKLVSSEFKVIFRRLTFDTLSLFLDIRNQVRNSLHDSREFGIEECQKWFRSKEQSYWLIYLDGVIIGYFRFSVDSEDPGIGIIGMDLDPKVHGRGLAKRLYYLFCDDVIISSGVEILTLRVLKSNTVALSLYKSMGMIITEESNRDYFMSIGVTKLLTNLSKYFTNEAETL